MLKKENHPFTESALAAAPRLLLRRLPVSNPKGAVLRRKVHDGGFPLSLQHGSDSNHNVLHLVLLVLPLSVGPIVRDRVGGVLGGGFKEHHVASLGETHSPLLAHLGVRAAGVAEVALIPQQEPVEETELKIRH